MRKIFFALLLNFHCILDAQKYVGYVVDCGTKETLIGATIADNTENYGVSTNVQGYFVLFSKSAITTVDVSYIGYKSKKINLDSFTNGSTICLEKGYELDEIQIKENSGTRTINEQLNIVSIPIEQAKRVPMLLGEVDVIKALQTKPGVSQGYEGSAGLFVRGGTPDQNLFLVDDNPLYNGSHLLGFLSAVNGDAIKSIDLHKGYFPPKYGGRLSSIVDIQMKDGDKTKRAGELSIGLVSSKLAFSLPIVKDKITLTANARSTYLNLVGLIIKDRYKKMKTDRYENYWFYDTNLKLHYKINANNQLYLNFFSGYDYYKNNQRMGLEGELITRNTWGSKLAGIRYSSIIKPNLILNATVGLNKFTSDIIGNSVLTDENINNTFRSSIAGGVGKINFDYLTTAHKLNFGLEHKIEDVFPGKTTTSDGKTNFILPNDKLLASTAMYLEDRWKISSIFELQSGLRYNYLTGSGFKKLLLEPRFQIGAAISNNDLLRLSFNRMHQNVGFLANNGLAFPTDFWIPSFDQLPVSTALHYSFGYGKTLKNWTLTTDLFYKTMNNLIGLKPGTDYFNYKNTVIENIDLGIEGRVKGLELGINYSSKNTSAWLSYTLSRNERRLAGISNGEWYPFNYDKTHELSLVYQTNLSKTWELSTAFNYSTGRAFTLPSTYTNTIGSFNNFALLPIYEQYNNVRFPDNHRLDISVTKNYSKSKLSFGFYNTYAKNNPFYLEYSLGTSKDNINPRVKKIGLFGPIPFINYSRTF